MRVAVVAAMILQVLMPFSVSADSTAGAGGAARPSPVPTGVLVAFKNYDPAAQDRIHQKLKTQLGYRSSQNQVDVVLVGAGQNHHGEAVLRQTCDAYLKYPEVAHCEPDWPLVRQRNEHLLCLPSVMGVFLPIAKVRAPTDAVVREFCSLVRRGPKDSYLEWGGMARAGSVPPFWAQEAVGADLTRSFLDQYDSAHKEQPSRIVSFGVVDSGTDLAAFSSLGKLGPELSACAKTPETCPGRVVFDSHGFEATSIAIGPDPVGVGARAQMTHGYFLKEGDRDGSNSLLLQGIDHLLASTRTPEVLNFSMAGLSSSLSPAFQKLAGRGTLIVKSAGNEYPSPPRDLEGFPGIVVGSVAPDGLNSLFSTESEKVDISAPSDFDLASFASNGNGTPFLSSFSGTSGAAPQVSGALTNVLSLISGMTTDEAKVLLRKTAIRTPAFRPGNNKNGAGALNAYKMVRVAERLKKKGWPSVSARELLNDPSTYDFASEAKSEAALGNEEMKSSDCKIKKRGFDRIRAAMFLDPENAALRKQIANLYREERYAGFATYFEPSDSATVILEREDDPYMRRQFLLRADRLDLILKDPKQMSTFSASDSKDQDGIASQLAQQLGTRADGMLGILRQLRKDGNPVAENLNLVWGVWAIPEARQAEYARYFLDSPNPNVRVNFIKSMQSNGSIAGKRAAAAAALHDPELLAKITAYQLLPEVYSRSECLKLFQSTGYDVDEQARPYIDRARKACEAKK